MRSYTREFADPSGVKLPSTERPKGRAASLWFWLMLWTSGLVGAADSLSYTFGEALDPETTNADDALPEYQIKAAFLHHFVRYSEWPKEALGEKTDPIELLIIGKSPFGSVLKTTFDGKTLHDRKVVIRYAQAVPEKITAHLVFVTGIGAKEEEGLRKRCRKKPILLIGDEKGFAARGSCANFYVEKKKVRFEVNLEEVKSSGLTISSQLLKLATIVKAKGGGK